MRAGSRHRNCLHSAFMKQTVTNVAVLGSTGSIGRSTLEVIRSSEGRLAAVGLSAHGSLDLLQQQAGAFSPQWIVATDSSRAANWPWSLPAGVEVLVGTWRSRKPSPGRKSMSS